MLNTTTLERCQSKTIINDTLSAGFNKNDNKVQKFETNRDQVMDIFIKEEKIIEDVCEDHGEYTIVKKEPIEEEDKNEIQHHSCSNQEVYKEDIFDIIAKDYAERIRNMSTDQQLYVQKIITDAIFHGESGQLTNYSRLQL